LTTNRSLYLAIFFVNQDANDRGVIASGDRDDSLDLKVAERDAIGMADDAFKRNLQRMV
jgi:hypothetical protein